MMTKQTKTEHESMQADEIKLLSRRVLRYFLPFKPYLSLAVIGYLLYAISQPAFALLMEGFIRALDGELVDNLFLIPAACMLIAVFRGVGSYLGTYYMGKASANVVHRIREELFSHLIALPLNFYDKNNSGSLVSLFTYNTTILTNATTQALTIVVREGLAVIALLSYLVYQSPTLTLTFLLLGPPLALAISWIGKKIKKFGQGIQASMGDLNHAANQSFLGIKLIKSSVSEQAVSDKFSLISRITKVNTIRLLKVSSIYTPMMQMLIVFIMAIVMYVILFTDQGMDSAELIAYVTAIALLPKPIKSLSDVYPKFLQGIVAAKAIFDFIDKEKERDQGSISAGHIDGEIGFNHVSFSYPKTDKQVIDDFTLAVKPGQTAALVGRSGSGKSTLVNLIPNFYSLTGGELLIDGKPVTDYSLAYLRKHIAIVSQDVVLFDDSIANNIAFGMPDATQEQIKAAALAANAAEFIDSLPNQYNTLVGENGTLLSGGQKQRIAIARAILRDASILILDEATSALDNESEVKVQKALETVMEGRTTIVIAHRLSTVEKADVIVVLDHGKIIEQGSHDSLMQNNGEYRKMVQRNFDV